jgi:hypothetical protein
MPRTLSRRSRFPGGRRFSAIAAAALAGAFSPLAATPLAAQRVTLQIRPHTGDTLRMRLDQESELTGVRKMANGESSAMVMNTMRVFSRAIVESSNDKETTLLTVTDSVQLNTTDGRARAQADRAEEQLRGQRARIRIAPDGTVGMANADAHSPRDMAQVVSLMPATFPRSAIDVGESWIREMPLPAGLQLGAQLAGKLHVTFRFDSLTHGGEWAFVSMRGDVQPAKGPGATAGVMLERGTVTGTMLVDQKRGWLTESWFNIVISSLQHMAPSSGGMSMHVQTRITQHMHTFDRPER